MSALLSIERDGAVAILTMNRPEAMNALNRALIGALATAFRDLSNDDTLRAVVWTGAGRAFSAGVDLKELAAADKGMERLNASGGDDLFAILRAFPHPVIAAVNGYAVTGGLELALMADFILCSDNAKFADTHGRVGIVPSWGMTQVLPRLIGPARTRMMSMTGSFIDAATALEWGLVAEVLPPDALLPRARELAAMVAETDARTAGTIRRLINDGADLPLPEALAREAAAHKAHLEALDKADVARGRDRVLSGNGESK